MPLRFLGVGDTKFFQEDIRAYKEFRAKYGDDRTGSGILEEWADIAGLPKKDVLDDSHEGRAVKLQTLSDIVSSLHVAHPPKINLIFPLQRLKILNRTRLIRRQLAMRSWPRTSPIFSDVSLNHRFQATVRPIFKTEKVLWTQCLSTMKRLAMTTIEHRSATSRPTVELVVHCATRSVHRTAFGRPASKPIECPHRPTVPAWGWTLTRKRITRTKNVVPKLIENLCANKCLQVKVTSNCTFPLFCKENNGNNHNWTLWSRLECLFVKTSTCLRC